MREEEQKSREIGRERSLLILPTRICNFYAQPLVRSYLGLKVPKTKGQPRKLLWNLQGKS